MSEAPIRQGQKVYEVFWHAFCSCGWMTRAPNEAQVVGDKVRNHLMTFHRDNEATVEIKSQVQTRQVGRLPALGAPVGVEPPVEIPSDR